MNKEYLINWILNQINIHAIAGLHIFDVLVYVELSIKLTVFQLLKNSQFDGQFYINKGTGVQAR